MLPVPSQQNTLETKPLKTHMNSNGARGLMALKINEVIKEAQTHVHGNSPHMEQTAGEQASLYTSYGENLESGIMETAVSMWQLTYSTHTCSHT